MSSFLNILWNWSWCMPTKTTSYVETIKVIDNGFPKFHQKRGKESLVNSTIKNFFNVEFYELIVNISTGIFINYNNNEKNTRMITLLTLTSGLKHFVTLVVNKKVPNDIIEYIVEILERNKFIYITFDLDDSVIYNGYFNRDTVVTTL